MESTYENKTHIASVLIRQKTTTGDYDFKSNKEQDMFEFYFWLSYDLYIDQVSMVKTTTGYERSFSSSSFVPGIDNKDNFVGIDV